MSDPGLTLDQDFPLLTPLSPLRSVFEFQEKFSQSGTTVTLHRKPNMSDRRFKKH